MRIARARKDRRKRRKVRGRSLGRKRYLDRFVDFVRRERLWSDDRARGNRARGRGFCFCGVMPTPRPEEQRSASEEPRNQKRFHGRSHSQRGGRRSFFPFLRAANDAADTSFHSTEFFLHTTSEGFGCRVLIHPTSLADCRNSSSHVGNLNRSMVKIVSNHTGSHDSLTPSHSQRQRTSFLERTIVSVRRRPNPRIVCPLAVLDRLDQTTLGDRKRLLPYEMTAPRRTRTTRAAAFQGLYDPPPLASSVSISACAGPRSVPPS
jgi:hypothetical protein